MAAVKRKQDEKHLKMLRDMAALPHNKQCFDCHQRGPTYINMTIGSFVCTSCSGILRGINPPHRVKSISMASFTPEEIEFIKCHGNDFCRKVWLGLYDSRTGMPEPDSREEQKVKDFMVQKYERKRWYVAPTDTMKEEAKRINEAATNKQPSTRPLKSLLGENAPRLVVKEEQSPQQTPKSQFPVQSTPASQPVTQSSPQSFPSPGQQSQSSQSKASTTMDLLGDLGGDPFAASTPGPPSSFGGGGGSGDNFADFSNFNQFPAPASTQQPFQAFQTPSNPLVPLGNAPSQTPVSVPNGGFTGTNSTQGPSVFSAPAPSGGDKYSALSDLFSDSSSGQTESGSVSWSGGNSGTGMSWTGGSSSNATTGIDWNSSGNSSNAGVNWNSTGSTSTPSTMGMNWNSPVGSQSSGFTSSGGNMFGGSVVSSQSAAGGMSGSNPFGSVTAPPPSFGGKTMFSAGAPGQIQVQGSLGQPNPASGGFGQPNPASGGFGQSNPASGGFGQPNPASGGFGQPNPASGGFGQPNPASGGFGQPNPASGGFGQPTSQSSFGQPVSSGQSALNTAFGGTTGFGGSAGVGMGVNPSPALSQFGMSNGNSSFNSMGPVNSSAGFGAFSQPQTVPNYGIQMTAPSGQFGNKFGATDAQMQGFPGDWGQVQGQVPTANPFMSAASQPVAPKGGSTNPFL